MLEVRELECVRGDHRLFAGLNFTLQAGELLHLRGSNGSGKTSLLRTVCGLMVPASGDVLWQGKNIRSLRDEFFRNLTYLGHLGAIKGDMSAWENLRMSCQMTGLDVSDNRIVDALVQMGLGGREELPTKVLSQGQKRRVALARLLISETPLWVLDEPFTALDVGAVDLLKGLIGKHLQAGGMVILTTHQEVDLVVGAMKELNLDS
jgi:heme exporter protein A